jgi:hypothetical protein
VKREWLNTHQPSQAKLQGGGGYCPPPKSATDDFPMQQSYEYLLVFICSHTLDFVKPYQNAKMCWFFLICCFSIAHFIKPYWDQVHFVNWISVSYYEIGYSFTQILTSCLGICLSLNIFSPWLWTQQIKKRDKGELNSLYLTAVLFPPNWYSL